MAREKKEKRVCEECNGSGKEVISDPTHHKGWYYEPCEICGGSGKIVEGEEDAWWSLQH